MSVDYLESVVRRGRWPFAMAVMIVSLVCGISPGLSHARAQTDAQVIDACQYGDDAAARAAWHPMAGTSPASMATIEGEKALRFPCSFAGKAIERASWDRNVKLDLSSCRGLQFQLYCRDASPVSQFSLYLESGEGWYATTFYPESSGWNTIHLDKASMTVEGKPAGWTTIKTIRVSAWRGADTDTEFNLRDLRKIGQLGVDTLVAIVRCDSAAQSQPQETRSIEEFCGTVAKNLETIGVSYATLSDLDLTADVLRATRLVILPHNPTMPAPTVERLAGYVKAGGRLLTFYGMPSGLRAVTHIDAGSYLQPKPAGQFSAMKFDRKAIPGAPELVGQHSWNINEPKPVPGQSRMVAEWLDDAGRPTGHAAVVASSNCVEVSHVLLTDDPANKSRMLLAIVGYLEPQIWKQVSGSLLAGIGQIAGHRDFDESAREIARMGQDDPRVRTTLAETKALRDEAARLGEEGRYAEACDRAQDASRRMLEAFCQAQRPLEGEFRAFWCHSAFGVEGLKWDEAIDRLADNGFTAILPNMLWGGLAYYPSEILPVAPEVASRGDQIAECLAACKKRGLQVHVWKVNWNASNAPRSFLDRMRSEGRLQASSHGKEEPWLCPSHPDNQKLEIDAMVEVARRYDVDGIHFDYIRYPDGDHCYCAGCKHRFEETNHLTVSDWPKEVLAGGPHRQAWLDWRRDNITTVVKSVSEQARAIKPKIKLSAAVFRNWPADRDTVGQDWKLWCDRGYLDFVCPMDYTSSNAQFENWVRPQRDWAGSKPCYPGIGAWVLAPDRVIEQIQVTRQHDTRGFTIFNYDAKAARDLVPLLGEGITRKPPSESKPR